MTTPGLRERKKRKTRWAIQEHAVRLFAQQGYDATTVEQIAAAAEVSPSTFFRYFKTKEDVVIEDDYDPLLIAAIQAAPPELAPIPAMRYGIRAAFTQIGAPEYQQLAGRMQLIMAVPALRARVMDNFFGTIDVIAGPIATRVGVEPSDLRVRALAGAFVGCLIPVTEAWARSGGEQDLAELIDQVLASMESGFAFTPPDSTLHP
jgi:AcrR family transcriptional regulator